MIRVVAQFHLKPENVEEALELVKKMVEATRKEEGCAQYDLAQSPEAPEQIVILEGWETKEAVDAHMASDHFKSIVPAVGKMCQEPPTIKSYIQLI